RVRHRLPDHIRRGGAGAAARVRRRAPLERRGRGGVPHAARRVARHPYRAQAGPRGSSSSAAPGAWCDRRRGRAHAPGTGGHRCETLHGHNYRTRVVVEGGLDPEAHYVIDFSELKQLMKRLTDELDHKVLLPIQNPKLQVREQGDSVAVAVNGRPRYVFPKMDCALLPIPNTTVEMLAQYLAGRVCRELTASPGVALRTIEVEVEENFGQSATYRESLE